MVTPDEGRLPVVDDGGRLVGCLSQGGPLRARRRKIEEEG